MKKIALIMLALLPVMMGWSQDTVGSFLRDGYYYDTLPDLKEYYFYDWVTSVGNRNGIQAKEMYVKDKESMTVYGVAATMLTGADLFWIDFPPDSVIAAEGINVEEWIQVGLFDFYSDTSTANLFEYLGLYLRDADSIVPQRQVMVHRRNDRPAFYYSTGIYNEFGNQRIFPMYEKYFDSAFVVTDTFYMGVTQYSMEDVIGTQTGMAFGLFCIDGHAMHGTCETHVFRWNPASQLPDYVRWIRECTAQYYMIFPILTPEPDVPDPGDTTAVNVADLVSRYVTVQPNPAMEEARVLSSFGLTHIEAYSSEGRRVLDRAAEGMEATIDVKAWPAGTYLLRVTTPLGTTTKKLLVR